MHNDGLGLPKDATPEMIDKEINRIFASTFSSEDGRKCLNIILADLFYFDTCHTDAEQALSNYGKFMINERMGVKDTISITDLMIVMAQNKI